MLKFIHKSILAELSIGFFLSLVSLNFILVMENVLRLSRSLSGVGASLTDMALIILYLQPQIMVFTIPMSLLLASLLTYGRMNADNELTTLRNAGMSFAGISTPVFVLGFAGFILELLVSFFIGPASTIRLRDSMSEIIMKRAPMAIESGVFNTSFSGITILVGNKPSPEKLEGIFIYDNRNPKEPRVLVAKEGNISSDQEHNLSMHIKDGYVHIARPEGSTEIFFKGYTFYLNLVMQSRSWNYGEMTPFELIRAREKADTKDVIPILLEFHRRLSLPFVCMIFMLLGPPLSLLSGKAGRVGGLTIGLGVFTVFYMLLMYSEGMARAGKISHYAGAWAPVVIIGLASLWAFRKAGSR